MIMVKAMMAMIGRKDNLMMSIKKVEYMIQEINLMPNSLTTKMMTLDVKHSLEKLNTLIIQFQQIVLLDQLWFKKK